MEIRTYDQVNPLDVLVLNQTALYFPLTPRLAATLRQHDQRYRDFFCLHAVEDGVVAGQVGLLTTQVQTTEGPMPVGCAFAVCTLPGFGRRGIAAALMQAAEEKARELGCKAITLNTSRSRVAHRLYRERGYADILPMFHAYSFAGAYPEQAGLIVRQAEPEELPALEESFFANTLGMTGFVLRQPNFLRAAVQMGLGPREVHAVCMDGSLVGYVLARPEDELLVVRCAVLPDGLRLAPVLGALRERYGTPYVQVEGLIRPEQVRELAEAGFRVEPSYGTLMLLPLEENRDFRSLLGIDQERFFMGQLDFT